MQYYSKNKLTWKKKLIIINNFFFKHTHTHHHYAIHQHQHYSYCVALRRRREHRFSRATAKESWVEDKKTLCTQMQQKLKQVELLLLFNRLQQERKKVSLMCWPKHLVPTRPLWLNAYAQIWCHGGPWDVISSCLLNR